MDHFKNLEERIIRLALEEDRVEHDVTTNSLQAFDSTVSAMVIAKEEGIISGTSVFRSVFIAVDPLTKVTILRADGSKVFKGEPIIEIQGLKSSILKAERTALNFIQRLSGIATLTGRFVSLMKGSGITLLDTRKTTPGLRYLEKKAVLDGGGKNHRMNLEDMAMIKDNHIRMAGSITNAFQMIRKHSPLVRIEIEVSNLAELKEALSNHADVIMLDNFDESLLQEAISLKTGRVKFEISGNITLQNIKSKLITGIDHISSGALTHSFRSLDISLEITDRKMEA